MRPRLILHAGTHKTGTTAIQAFCATNRDELNRRGYHYPTLPVPGRRASNQHHDLAHAFAGRSSRLTRDEAAKLFCEFAEAAFKDGKTTLISAEPVWRHVLTESPERKGDGPADGEWLAGRDAYLAELADALRPFDCHIVLVFRNPADFLQSNYIERISSSVSGVKQDFHEFTTRSLDTMMRYGDNARLFRKNFQSVQCLLYEELCETNLMDAFFDAVGVNIQGLEPGSLVRKSIPPAEAKIINLIKLLVPREASKKNVREFLADANVRKLVASYSDRNRKSEYWTNGADRNEVLATLAPQLRMLADEFGVRTSRWQDELACRPDPKQLADIDPATESAARNLVAKWWKKPSQARRRFWKK